MPFVGRTHGESGRVWAGTEGEVPSWIKGVFSVGF